MMGCIVNSEFLRDVALHPADGQAYAGMAGRPTFHAEIGRELAQLREGKGWSQRRAVDIARRKGLPLGLGALRFLEDGKTKHPDADVLKTLCVLYGLSFRELAGRFVRANYGSDLIRQIEESDSTLPSGGFVDVTAAARIFELEQTNARLRATLEKVTDVASDLLQIAAEHSTSTEAGVSNRPKPGARRGAGKAG